MAYASLAELKTHLRITDGADDAALTRALASASSVIDRWCNTTFSGSPPDAVKDACLIQAARFFSRRTSPHGIAGSPESGELRLLNSLDVDVQQLLAGVRVLVVE